MIDLDKIAEIRTRCDIAEDNLQNAGNSEDVIKCYRMLVDIRRNLDIAEEISRKCAKSV